MKVTRQRGRRHGNLLVLEVITTGEVDVPTVGEAYVTTDIEGLGQLIRIAHLLVIEVTGAILLDGDTITEVQGPRHAEGHVAILVGLGLSSATFLGTVLTTFHVGVDIRIQRIVLVLVVIIIFFLVLFLVVVFISFATQPTEELVYLLVVEVIGDVIGDVLETAPLTLLPVGGMVTLTRLALGVQLIDVAGKRRAQVQRVALGELQTDGRTQRTQRLTVSSKVIGHAQTQFIDETDLLEARGVVVALELHLHIVGEVNGHATRHTLVEGRSEQGSLIGGVLYQRDIAIGIGLLVGLEIAIARSTEVRCIAEGNGRRHDVADGLNLFAEEFTVRHIETIQLRR